MFVAIFERAIVFSRASDACKILPMPIRDASDGPFGPSFARESQSMKVGSIIDQCLLVMIFFKIMGSEDKDNP